MNVKTTYDRSADFASYRTFAQAPEPPSIDNLPGYGEVTGRLIQRRIASKLEDKGLHEASWDEADLHVRFLIGGQTYQPADDPVAQAWADPTVTEPEEYVDASLVIEMADRRRGRRVWHGCANEEVFSQTADGEEILRAVDSVLEKYPPSSRQK